MGQALGHAREDIGGGRRDDQQVGFARQADMAHLAFIGQREEIAIDLVAGQRRERERRHELGAGRGQHHAHAGTAFAQTADQIEALVSCDTARDEKQDAFTRQHVGCSRTNLRWKDVNKIGTAARWCKGPIKH